jgi:hypothetical protein
MKSWMSKQYFLTTDHDCHWFLVPVDKRKSWERWCDLPENDEHSWTPPKYAIAIDGPQSVKFEQPKIGSDQYGWKSVL